MIQCFLCVASVFSKSQAVGHCMKISIRTIWPGALDYTNGIRFAELLHVKLRRYKHPLFFAV
jgi:hypothetical protein